jgi:hypothetical protein
LFNQNPAEKVVVPNEMIKNYADANGILYLDYFRLWQMSAGFACFAQNDEVHPNKQDIKDGATS